MFGDLKYVFHRGVLAEPVGTIPAALFSFFQLVFQETVCAIAVGGACERYLIVLVFVIFAY
jgi:Amt family ammonium transporter